MSDYDIPDGQDSQHSTDSGSEEDWPTQEEYVDYAPLERMQGSRRKDAGSRLEPQSRARAARFGEVRPQSGFRRWQPPHCRPQQRRTCGVNLFSNPDSPLPVRGRLPSQRSSQAGDDCTRLSQPQESTAEPLADITNLAKPRRRPPGRPPAINQKKNNSENGKLD